MFGKATREELPQRALDDRAQRAMPRSEAFVVDAEKLLDVPLDELEKRRLPRSPRLVDPAGDLHAQP